MLVGSLLAFAALAYFAYGIDPSALGKALAGADRTLMLAVVVVVVASYGARSWLWGSLLQPLVVVRQFDLFSSTIIGFAASLVVPRSGELLRPWLVARRYRVPASGVFATVVVERLVDLATVLLLFALYLFVLPRPAAQVDSAWIGILRGGGLLATLLLCVLLVVLWLWHAEAVHPEAGRLSWLQRLANRGPAWLRHRIAGLLKGFAGGLAVLRAPWPHWLLISAQSLLLWLLTAYTFDLTNQAFGIHLPWHCGLLILAFVIVGESIPTPGLVGGFHAFYLLVLTEVYGVDHDTAAAAAIAAHALGNLPVLLLGLLLAPRERLSLRRAAAVGAEVSR